MLHDDVAIDADRQLALAELQIGFGETLAEVGTVGLVLQGSHAWSAHLEAGEAVDRRAGDIVGEHRPSGGKWAGGFGNFGDCGGCLLIPLEAAERNRLESELLKPLSGIRRDSLVPAPRSHRRRGPPAKAVGQASGE